MVSAGCLVLTKVKAGARYIQTQLCFDIPALKRYMTHQVEAQLTWQCAVIVSIATLPSAVTARWLRENQRGAVGHCQNKLDPPVPGVSLQASTPHPAFPRAIQRHSFRWL